MIPTIQAIRNRQTRDEIHGDLLKGALRERERLQLTVRLLPLGVGIVVRFRLVIDRGLQVLYVGINAVPLGLGGGIVGKP